jgi:hypothetical protein
MLEIREMHTESTSQEPEGNSPVGRAENRGEMLVYRS